MNKYFRITISILYRKNMKIQEFSTIDLALFSIMSSILIANLWFVFFPKKKLYNILEYKQNICLIKYLN